MTQAGGDNLDNYHTRTGILFTLCRKMSTIVPCPGGVEVSSSGKNQVEGVFDDRLDYSDRICQPCASITIVRDVPSLSRHNLEVS